LDALSSCDAIKGDIYITGGISAGSIANVKAVYGDLIISNATKLSTFSADSISAISGELNMESLTILSEFSMGSLISAGAINWVTLPALIQTGFKQVTDCNSIYISDTQLSSLDGLNPTNVETFDINNNLNLASITSDVQTVSKALSISHNGDQTEVKFDDLKWANNLTFYSVTSISMASLEAINASAGFFESSVSSLKFPLVATVGGDLTIENNDDLEKIDFSNLTTIGGGFVIENNTELKTIDNLDDLKTIDGAVVLKGDFDKCSIPNLKTVRGAFTVDSTGDFSCSAFDKVSKEGYIRGDYNCKASSSSSAASKTKTSSSSKTGSASSESGSASSDSSSSSKTSSSKAGAAELLVSPVSVFGTAIAVLFALF